MTFFFLTLNVFSVVKLWRERERSLADGFCVHTKSVKTNLLQLWRWLSAVAGGGAGVPPGREVVLFQLLDVVIATAVQIDVANGERLQGCHVVTTGLWEPVDSIVGHDDDACLFFFLYRFTNAMDSSSAFVSAR